MKVTYEQMMRVPSITRLVARLQSSGTFFQSMFRSSLITPPNEIASTRHAGYDTYASTRTMAPLTAPGAPPRSIGHKPIGSTSVFIPRIHSSIPIYDERVRGNRPPGGPIGTLDDAGRRYIALQLQHFSDTYKNTREYMFCKMLQGGLGLKNVDGNSYYFVDSADPDADETIDYNIPASNKGDLAGLIDVSWKDPAAKLVKQFLNIGKRSSRISGYQPVNVVVNGSTIAPLFDNDQLAKVRGSSFKIFDTFTRTEIDPSSARNQSSYTVVFGALPFIKFHVYNEVLAPGILIPNFENQTSVANTELMIPTGYAMVLPEPDNLWHGLMGYREEIRERVDMVNTRSVTGFGVWTTPAIDPPRRDIKGLDNILPVLYIPNAVHYARVWSEAEITAHTDV